MRNFILLVLVFFSIISYSSNWNSLSIHQAKKVIKFLDRNPYIFEISNFDCEVGEFWFYKVLSTKIETHTFNSSKFCVKAQIECNLMLAFMENDSSQYHYFDVATESKYSEIIISMNYNFGFSRDLKMAVPFYQIMPYSKDSINLSDCNFPLNYLQPKIRKEIFDDVEYRDWYSQNISMID